MGNPLKSKDASQQDQQIHASFAQRSYAGELRPYAARAYEAYKKDPVKDPGWALNSEPYELSARNGIRGIFNGVSRTLTGGIVRAGDYLDNASAKLWGERNEDGSKIGWLSNAGDRLERRWDNFLDRDHPDMPPDDRAQSQAWFKSRASVPQAVTSVSTAVYTHGKVPGSVVQATGNTIQAAIDTAGRMASGPTNQYIQAASDLAETGTDTFSRLSLANRVLPTSMRAMYRVPAMLGVYTTADTAAALGRGEPFPHIGNTAASNLPFAAMSALPYGTGIPAIGAMGVVRGAWPGVAERIADRFPSTAPYLLGDAERLERLRKGEDKLRQADAADGGHRLADAQANAATTGYAKYINAIAPGASDMPAGSAEQEQYLYNQMNTAPSDKKAAKLRIILAQGGTLPPEMFNPETSGLSREDTDALFQQYAMTSYDKYNGNWFFVPDALDTAVDNLKLAFGNSPKYIADMTEKDPAFRAATVSYVSGKAAQALFGDANNPDAAVEQVSESGMKYFAALPEDVQYEIADSVISKATPEQALGLLQKASKERGDSSIDPAMVAPVSKVFLHKASSDPEFMENVGIPALEMLSKQGTEGAGQSPESAAAILRVLMDKPEETKKVLSYLGESRTKLLLNLVPALAGTEQGAELPGIEPAALDRFKNEIVIPTLKTSVWDAIKANPIENIPTGVALWCKSKGWSGVADWLADPIKFWLTAGLLCTAGLTVVGSLGSRDNPAPTSMTGSNVPQPTQQATGSYLQALQY